MVSESDLTDARKSMEANTSLVKDEPTREFNNTFWNTLYQPFIPTIFGTLYNPNKISNIETYRKKR